MDYYSKWLEVKQMKGKTSNNVIATLKPIFSCHGIPSMLIADNMPFNSYECRKFAKEWAFKIITTSPHLSRSNGQAESGVKIAKMILKKNVDLHSALLNYRNTPIPNLGVSPAQLLYSRRLRTKLPVNENLLRPNTVDISQITEKLNKKQELYKQYFDKKAKSLREYEVGNNVMVRAGNQNEWNRGKVVKVDDAPRSYWVKCNGNTVRRSSQHLKTTNNDFRDYEPSTDIDNTCLNNHIEQPEPLKETTVNKTPTLENYNLHNQLSRNRRLPIRYKDYVLD